MVSYETKIRTAARYVKKHLTNTPRAAIVLGSGLGTLVQPDNAKSIAYKNIPYFPQTTVPGHEGKLIIGELAGHAVLVLRGRKHYYEVADKPHGMRAVVFSVHVLAELGIPYFIATNAAGGLNTSFAVGDVMLISSHISFLPNPLMGRQLSDVAERFVPLHDAYDEQLRSFARGKGVREGVYLALSGPSYETPAECLAYRKLGADAVGMSTVPEIIAARSRGMTCFAFSLITNKIAKNGMNNTSHDEVKAVLASEHTRKHAEAVLLCVLKRIA
ncbi:MAG: purine-nucleoside phosphorylase [archaeon]